MHRITTNQEYFIKCFDRGTEHDGNRDGGKNTVMRTVEDFMRENCI